MAVEWKRLAYTSQIRELLTANRTYYVRTDGSDSNNGLANTSGGAFLTTQHAYDVITGTLDLGGKDVTVKSADGTYTGGLSLSTPWTGGGNVIFEGNTGDDDAVIWNVEGPVISIACVLPGTLYLRHIKLNISTGPYYQLIAHFGVGGVYARNLVFGDASVALYVAAPGAIIDLYGNCEITGDMGRFMQSASPGSYVYLDAYLVGSWTMTLTGTPAFSSAFASTLTLGHIYSSGSGITFSGSATGKRYDAVENSIIATEGGGANYFPGNSAGSTATGAIYS